MYHIAKFSENGKILVEIISANWKINGKNIFWPKNATKKKFEKYLKDQREPDSSWMQISCSLLKENLGFEEAEEYINTYICQVTSESDNGDNSDIERGRSLLSAKRKRHESPSTSRGESERPLDEDFVFAIPKAPGQNEDVSSLIRNLSQKLETIEQKQDAISTKQDILEQGIDKVLKLITEKGIGDVDDLLQDPFPYFPCDGASNLRELEKSLKNDEGKSQLITFLKTFGGKKLEDFLSRVLTATFTNRFAMSFNWTGENGKNQFEKLTFLTVLNKFAIKVFHTNQEEIKEKIKNWLRNASQRYDNELKCQEIADKREQQAKKKKEEEVERNKAKLAKNTTKRKRFQPTVADYFNARSVPEEILEVVHEMTESIHNETNNTAKEDDANKDPPKTSEEKDASIEEKDPSKIDEDASKAVDGEKSASVKFRLTSGDKVHIGIA